MRLTSHKTRRDSKLELSMTPMIDIVFLLLIFFMTTATFRKTEKELNPAIQVKKKSTTSTTSDFEPTIIDVTERDGRPVFVIGENVLTEFDELLALLKQFDNKQDGAFVRVSDEPPFEMAAYAIQACATAGYVPVTYVPNPN